AAEEIAVKKVAAAAAWTGALKEDKEV
ncbi:hypothetical protein A2U01_0111870, partial [Trifolium medium]|nr:hypothetical protein [Trifolium medium]